jgi:threonine/homoserine/homoserine lactone efflux protein
VASAQPGPFQTYLVNEALTSGWRKTLPAALAPLITDGPIIALVLFVLTRLPASFERALYFVSGLFILYLAFRAIGRWRNPVESEASGRTTLARAVIMNFISPGPYVFWGLIIGPTLLAAWRDDPVRVIAFVTGFYISLVGTFALFIVVFATASHLGPRVTRALSGISALVLLFFGLFQLYRGAAG